MAELNHAFAFRCVKDNTKEEMDIRSNNVYYKTQPKIKKKIKQNRLAMTATPSNLFTFIQTKKCKNGVSGEELRRAEGESGMAKNVNESTMVSELAKLRGQRRMVE